MLQLSKSLARIALVQADSKEKGWRKGTEESMAVLNRKEQGCMKCWPWDCCLLNAFSHLSVKSPKGRFLSDPVPFPQGVKSLCSSLMQ